jgi:hypothetical protein
MARSLRSGNEDQERRDAERRVQAGTGGLGYWAAVDYLRGKNKKVDTSKIRVNQTEVKK